MAQTVTGDLSFDEYQKIRRDNVGYRWDSSLVKVRLYIDATEAILTWGVEETEHSGERLQVNVEIMRKQLDKAVAWEASRSIATASPTVYQPAANWRCE